MTYRSLNTQARANQNEDVDEIQFDEYFEHTKVEIASRTKKLMICKPLKQSSYHYVAVKQFEIEKIWFSELKENISSFAKAVGPQNIVENIGVYYTTYPNQPQEKIMALICTPVMDCSLVQVYDWFVLKNPKSKFFPNELLQHVASNLVDAIYYFKANGKVHEGIKPSNIMLNKKGEIKLRDYGVASVLRKAKDLAATTSMTTTRYWPPELFDNAPYDYKGDVWSLGMTLAELVLGGHPFNTLKHYFLLKTKIQDPNIRDEIVKKLEDKNCDDAAKEFIASCFLPHKTRPTCDELMNSPFYSDFKTKTSQEVVAKFFKKIDFEQLKQAHSP